MINSSKTSDDSLHSHNGIDIKFYPGGTVDIKSYRWSYLDKLNQAIQSILSKSQSDGDKIYN